MKITNIECIPVQGPGRTLVIIIVDTDEGISGVGESGLQRRWQAIQGAVDHLKRWLVGEDPMRIEHLWQRMFRGGFYPGDRLIGSVISGIDIALWDIKGKALGVPVYELLGGRCRDYVQCFLNHTYNPSNPDEPLDPPGNLNEPEVAAEHAVQCRDSGHKFFRIGPAADSNDQLEPRQAVETLANQLNPIILHHQHICINISYL